MPDPNEACGQSGVRAGLQEISDSICELELAGETHMDRTIEAMRG